MHKLLIIVTILLVGIICCSGSVGMGGVIVTLISAIAGGITGAAIGGGMGIAYGGNAVNGAGLFGIIFAIIFALVATIIVVLF